MKIDEHIKNLEEYCQDDDLFEKDGDFKEFCDNHIADIKAVIQELKNTQSDLYEANNRINDLLEMIEQKNKIIDLMAKELSKAGMYKSNVSAYEIYEKGRNVEMVKMTPKEIIEYFEERCK